MQIRRKYNGENGAIRARNAMWKRLHTLCEGCGCETVLYWLVQKHRDDVRLRHGGRVAHWTDGSGIRHHRPVATIDHVLPRWSGGKNRRNLQLLCGHCHARKTSQEMWEHRKRVPGLCRKCGAASHPKRKLCNRCRMGNRYEASLRLPLGPLLQEALRSIGDGSEG